MPSWWHFATSEGTPGYALVMGLVVGTILTAINQGDFILAGEMPDLVKAGLTYMVPYCVATYGAVTAKRAAWRRQNGGNGGNGARVPAQSEATRGPA
jgi:hypothetical protein